MAIADRDASSHGLTPRVAKLDLASTTLPLLISVASRTGAFEVSAAVAFGLIREVVWIGNVPTSALESRCDELDNFLPLREPSSSW